MTQRLMNWLGPAILLVLATVGTVAAQIPRDGLILDLDADQAVVVEDDNRVVTKAGTTS